MQQKYQAKTPLLRTNSSDRLPHVLAMDMYGSRFDEGRTVRAPGTEMRAIEQAQIFRGLAYMYQPVWRGSGRFAKDTYLNRSSSWPRALRNWRPV